MNKLFRSNIHFNIFLREGIYFFSGNEERKKLVFFRLIIIIIMFLFFVRTASCITDLLAFRIRIYDEMWCKVEETDYVVTQHV